jgi:hypothetical protein
LSPDGKYLAYGINRSSRDNELRIVAVADAAGAAKVVPFGTQATFSADSKWVAYGVGMSESQEEKLRQQKKPVQRKAGVMNLASGEMVTVDGIESFSFNAKGTHLALKRYAPERKDSDPPAPPDDGPAAATLIVRELATGRDTTLGNVTEFDWQDKGDLLALTIGAEDKTGNGVQLFDAKSGTLRVLDSSPAIYSGLAWREDTDDLLVLRAKGDDKREGLTHAILAWRGLGATAVYDPSSAADFPAGLRVVSYRRPSWSDDGRTIFVGVARWDEKIAPAPKPKPEGGTGNGNGDGNARDAEKEPEEPANVDVWHARDVDVMPRQKVSARADRQRNMLAAWHLDSNRFVQLVKSLI